MASSPYPRRVLLSLVLVGGGSVAFSCSSSSSTPTGQPMGGAATTGGAAGTGGSTSAVAGGGASTMGGAGSPTGGSGGASGGGVAGASSGSGGASSGSGGSSGSGATSGAGGSGGAQAGQAGSGGSGGNAGGSAGNVGGSGGNAGASGASAGAAGSSGSVSYALPKWKALGGMPSPCYVEQLQNPSDVAPIGTWGACSDPTYQPCQQLALQGQFAPNDFGILTLDVDESSGPTRISMLIAPEQGLGQIAVIADEATLAPLWALRIQNTSLCQINTNVGFNGDEGVVDVQAGLSFASSNPGQALYAAVPFDVTAAPVLSPTFGVTAQFGPDQVSDHASNGKMLGLWGGGSRVASIDLTTGAVTTIDKGSAATAEAYNPIPAPGGFLLEVDGSPWSIAFTDGVSALAPLIAPPDSFQMSEALSGDSLVWMRGYVQTGPATFSALELWTAPFTTDASSLTPTKVRSLDLIQNASNPYSNAGNGWYSVGDANSNHGFYHFFHVPDGQERLFQPANFDFWYGPKITNTEFLIPVRPYPGNHGGATTLLRLPYSALPASPLPRYPVIHSPLVVAEARTRDDKEETPETVVRPLGHSARKWRAGPRVSEWVLRWDVG